MVDDRDFALFDRAARGVSVAELDDRTVFRDHGTCDEMHGTGIFSLRILASDGVIESVRDDRRRRIVLTALPAVVAALCVKVQRFSISIQVYLARGVRFHVPPSARCRLTVGMVHVQKRDINLSRRTVDKRHSPLDLRLPRSSFVRQVDRNFSVGADLRPFRKPDRTRLFKLRHLVARIFERLIGDRLFKSFFVAFPAVAAALSVEIQRPLSVFEGDFPLGLGIDVPPPSRHFLARQVAITHHDGNFCGRGVCQRHFKIFQCWSCVGLFFRDKRRFLLSIPASLLCLRRIGQKLYRLDAGTAADDFRHFHLYVRAVSTASYFLRLFDHLGGVSAGRSLNDLRHFHLNLSAVCPFLDRLRCIAVSIRVCTCKR